MIEHSVNRDDFDLLMVPNYSPLKIIPVRGQGSRVWDQNDKEYIDFAAGIAVTSLGHAHPKLVETLHDQANKIWHLSNVLTNEPALRLAKKLCDASFAERIFLCNSGSEANEAALKLARRYAFDHAGEDKHEIISFKQSFHGRTLFTVSVGGQPKYTQGFGPLPAGITHLEFNDVDALRAAVSDKTCAIIMEPVQGEGGIIPATKQFAQAARDLCDKHNALLIFDEVQCGVGRSGQLYAYMDLGVTPDILTSAKGLGGGFPIGAMLTTQAIAASFVVGTHGSTYGGNPLASAVAEAVIDTVNTDLVLNGVKTKHELLVSGLNEINERQQIFSTIRGQGLLLGCVLAQPYKGKARDILNAAVTTGLLLLVAGPDVIRLAPSLIIPDEDIQLGLEKLDAAITAGIKQLTAKPCL